VALDRQGRHAEAAAALRLIVAQKLPNAELALYHLAQLEQGPLADAAGAERDYLRYEKDYPQGALAQEAALSAIELTLKRGGFPDALGEMDRFLRAHPASERISTVHLLRGNVLRSQGNPQGALAEYAQVHGPQTEEDDALYFTALCHASGGSADAERAALSAYLQRFPAGKHVPDVRARLAQ
jgi:outer membrane protein assembly factor BamD (BamD/ComL family)